MKNCPRGGWFSRVAAARTRSNFHTPWRNRVSQIVAGELRNAFGRRPGGEFKRDKDGVEIGHRLKPGGAGDVLSEVARLAGDRIDPVQHGAEVESHADVEFRRKSLGLPGLSAAGAHFGQLQPEQTGVAAGLEHHVQPVARCVRLDRSVRPLEHLSDLAQIVLDELGKLLLGQFAETPDIGEQDRAIARLGRNRRSENRLGRGLRPAAASLPPPKRDAMGARSMMVVSWPHSRHIISADAVPPGPFPGRPSHTHIGRTLADSLRACSRAMPSRTRLQYS